MSTILQAKEPTPLLNCSDIKRAFQKLPLDEQGLFRAIEMVALPGTRFIVTRTISQTVVEVTTEDYPSDSPLFIDTRFTREEREAPPRKQELPPPDKILANLQASLGLPYIWGGNWGKGIQRIKELYPRSTSNQSYLQNRKFDKEETYFLRGVDCSGLLYEATDGSTPRNTADLFTFGQKVSSLSDVKPLDIIVWPGHVVICIDPRTVIESRLGHGVILSHLYKRTSLFLPNQFVIRRFL